MGNGIRSMFIADLSAMTTKRPALSPSTMVMGEVGVGGMDHIFKMGMKKPENSALMIVETGHSLSLKWAACSSS